MYKTIVMILGTLSLFQKRGLFYTEGLTYSKKRGVQLDEGELQNISGVSLGFEQLPGQLRITPVEENGDTDYITGVFEDESDAVYPYEVTVWLLVEEVPMAHIESVNK